MCIIGTLVSIWCKQYRPFGWHTNSRMECLSPHTHFCVCVESNIQFCWFKTTDNATNVEYFEFEHTFPSTINNNMCHHCGMQERFFISRIAFLIDNQFVFFCLVCLFLFCLCESVTLECFVAIQFKCTILLTCEKKPKLILMCAQSFSRCIIGRHTKFPSKCHFHFHSN